MRSGRALVRSGRCPIRCARHACARRRPRRTRAAAVDGGDRSCGGGLPRGGVVATAHGRRVHRAHDAPCLATSAVVLWRKRVWRCAQLACPVGTLSETHPLICAAGQARRPRNVLGDRRAGPRRHHGVGAARHLGVDWHTLSDAVEVEATARLEHPDRLVGVRTPRCRRARLAAVPARRGPGDDRDGRPDPRPARLPARPAARRRPRPVPPPMRPGFAPSPTSSLASDQVSLGTSRPDLLLSSAAAGSHDGDGGRNS